MKVAVISALAVSFLALPAVVLAQTAGNQMVATQASLVQTIDAHKAQIGSEFKVKLEKSVRLDATTTLPAGTLLVGNIVQDDMQVSGSAKLALRFTHATLKNGQNVPIRATIVGIARNADSTITWSPAVSSVDKVDVLSNVDLHSKTNSQNSGVFVSTKKDNVKIDGGSEFQIAITGGSGS